MKAAYADPPYPGCAKKHYASDPSGVCEEVDHAALVQQLSDYDAWALSTNSTALRELLPLMPDDTRIMAWVKPFASFKPGVRVAYTWEPVLVKLTPLPKSVYSATVRDHVSANITLKRGTHGAKPDEFCFWLFRVLGLQEGDEFHDLFPGSGAVTRCWEQYQRQETFERMDAEYEHLTLEATDA